MVVQRNKMLMLAVVIVTLAAVTQAADYVCHNYSPIEQGFISSGAFSEKEVCEHDPTRKFTRGANANYRGCGSCWCCKEVQPEWDCYNYNKKEQAKISKGTAERKVCNSDPLRKFTKGNNANYPGCGSCWCCKESWTCYNYSPLERKALEQGKTEKEVCEHTGDREFTGGSNDQNPGCGSCWCCARG